METAVWGVVSRVLENPALVLAELRRQRESTGEPLEGDFKRLRREISMQSKLTRCSSKSSVFAVAKGALTWL